VATDPIGSREVAFQRFRLRVLDGVGAGVQVLSDGDELEVGSAPGNHLVLEDPAVSRHHFALTASSAGFELRDLGSTNGTFVGGLRIKAAYLHAPASITAGRTVIGFEPVAETIRQALSPEERYGAALGSSPTMRRIFALLPRIAAVDTPVLVEGEAGTGKSLLAEALHAASARRAGALVAIDCSAIAPGSIERALFGDAAAAGACAGPPGALEAGRGGTVVLDEVGELPLDVQSRLLRALEDRAIRRPLRDPIAIDVRVIATTRRDLRREVNRGGFRSDLYYRLHTLRVRLPPLRERRDDVRLLAAHFYEQLTGRPATEAPAALLSALARHDWPGNLRELRGAVERAVTIGEPAPSDPPGAAPGTFDPGVPFRAAKERHLARWERDYLRELLALAGGNVARAARLARMDRTHLRELIDRHGVLAAP
jgi:two-component system response regulator GlrR